MCLEKRHRKSFGIAMDHNMEDMSKVNEQPQKFSNVASTGLLSIKTPESLYGTVTVARELVICLTVMPCLSKGS